MIVATRKEWGASFGVGRVLSAPVGRVYIHHSGIPDVPADALPDMEAGYVRSIERYHVAERGWVGIGYSFLVFQSGRAYTGRGWGRVGAHTENQNSKSYGVCFVIDGDRRPATSQALEAVRGIIADGIGLGRILPAVQVLGHRDAKATTCPGRYVYAQLAEMYPAVVVPPTRPVLRLGATGEAVQELQLAIEAVADGDFGPETDRLLRAFQATNGLLVDGIAGPKTWAVIDGVGK